MSLEKIPLETLNDYLPDNAYALVVPYIKTHKVHLTITPRRTSVLGDYRHPLRGQNHRISVNGDLNKYAFLLTLLHEIAHLIAFEKHSARIAPHGKEWKHEYAQLLNPFLQLNIFPDDIKNHLIENMHNRPASSQADNILLKILRRYDARSTTLTAVEDLTPNTIFKTENGRVFQMIKKIRKRYECIEIETKRRYLFNPIYEVKVVEQGVE